MTTARHFYGKYRGIVTDNQDPLQMGRVRARVPDITGSDESGWALPCVPFAGNKMGFYALPDVNARVWIEFEQGNPDYPIWSGCWWGSQDELPDEAGASPYDRLVIKTAQKQLIILDDGTDTGQITIQTAGGQSIVMNSESIKITLGDASIEISDADITIDNGSGATVELSGPSVSINDDALEVT